MLRIGFQGNWGSNSESAAYRFASETNMTQAEFIPLISPKNVVRSLLDFDIDYGVIAYKNTIGGLVNDSVEALKEPNLEILSIISLPINHHLYVMNPSFVPKDIHTIKSHPQALKQCHLFLQQHFSHAAIVPVEDTATAASSLANGTYDPFTAVICSDRAGDMYQLHMLFQNIQNVDMENHTTFYLLKRHT